MTGRTPTCAAHCVACDSCHSSLGSFDAHRSGDFTTGRVCLFPDEVEGLVARPGACDLRGDEQRSTVVYSLAVNLGRDLGSLIRGDDE